MLVAFASQTGTAQALAWQTAKSLRTAGVPSQVRAMSELAADDLRQVQRALFLVSTYGEGDAPDNAALFSRRLMTAQLPLRELHYGVLALGDRAYTNFRGFGLDLDRWLNLQGAQPLFERVDVDKSDFEALHLWQHRLSRIAGTSDLPDWQAPDFEQWRLQTRRLLNPGSAGGATFHLELTWLPARHAPHWEVGDLLQVLVPSDETRPREYSVASLPTDRSVHLLVRQERHADGTLGLASGWLTHGMKIGDLVKARLRPHPHFHLGDKALRPLILIGNGTGLAGLRVLLKAREASGFGRNWLLYGERNLATDYYYREEIERWRASGVLERVDIVFSRDQPERRYVQHRLAEAAGAVRVCAQLDELMAQGRYRRDVY